MFGVPLPIRIDVSASSISDDQADARFDHPCPECGALVTLTSAVASSGDGKLKLDRLAHALCGCYVLSMPASGLARLLSSVLEATGNPAESRPEQ